METSVCVGVCDCVCTLRFLSLSFSAVPRLRSPPSPHVCPLTLPRPSPPCVSLPAIFPHSPLPLDPGLQFHLDEGPKAGNCQSSVCGSSLACCPSQSSVLLWRVLILLCSLSSFSRAALAVASQSLFAICSPFSHSPFTIAFCSPLSWSSLAVFFRSRVAELSLAVASPSRPLQSSLAVVSCGRLSQSLLSLTHLSRSPFVAFPCSRLSQSSCSETRGVTVVLSKSTAPDCAARRSRALSPGVHTWRSRCSLLDGCLRVAACLLRRRLGDPNEGLFVKASTVDPRNFVEAS